MPRKINKRKQIQAAKRKAAAEYEARQNKRWQGTRREITEAQAPRHIGMIDQGGISLAIAALVASGMFVRLDQADARRAADRKGG